VTFRPERYPAEWPSIREGIRLRTNNACAFCRAPNGVLVARHVSGESYMLEHGEVFDSTTGEYLGLARGSEYDSKGIILVVLTVAHLDHNEANNDHTNLAALCQRCHLQGRAVSARRRLGRHGGCDPRTAHQVDDAARCGGRGARRGEDVQGLRPRQR